MQTQTYCYVYFWTGKRWHRLKQRFAERILAERARNSMALYLPSEQFRVQEEA
jgi:uncharacterized protein with PIN domain